MSKRNPAPFHFFCSSVLHWSVDNDRVAAELRQRQVDGFDKNGKRWKGSIVRPNGYNIYKVPGDETATYNINYYTPQVPGTEHVGFFAYPEPKRTKKTVEI